MKDRRIDVRASSSDISTLRRASKNLEEMTGQKQNASKTMLTAVKIVADNKPDLFFVNRQAIREIENNIRQGQVMLQDFVNELSACLPWLLLRIEEIESFFGHSRLRLMVADHEKIRSFVIDRLYQNQQAKYPGLKFTRDNIDLPDLSKVLLVADKLIDIPEVQYREVGLFFRAYLIEGDMVMIVPSTVEQIKDQYRCYATTTDEKQRLAKARRLCETLTAFVRSEKITPEHLNIKGLCSWDDEAGRFEPVERYVKYTL